MKAHAGKQNGVSILRCQGNLSAERMVNVKSRVARLIHRNRKRLVFDMAKAEQIDFAGLGILVDRLQKIRALDGDIKMAHVQPQVSAVFARAGVDDLIEAYSSAQEAVRSYQVAA